MLNKLILFLIRKKLHLKKFQQFYFSNQAIKIEKYYFDNYGIMKISVCGLVRSNNCPNCGEPLPYNFDYDYPIKNKCCLECQQVLDWSDEDDR